VAYPTDYRPDNPLPRTPDNNRRAIGVTPRNMGRRYTPGQRPYGEAKARAEQTRLTEEETKQDQLERDHRPVTDRSRTQYTPRLTAFTSPDTSGSDLNNAQT
jgi:hypothetical protein